MGRKRKGRARGAGNGKETISTGPVTDASTGPDTGASTGETAGPVGHVAVEIDRAAILQVAAAVAVEAPAAPVAGTGDAPVQTPEIQASGPVLDPAAKASEVQPAVRFLVAQVFNVAAPAWEVTDEESNGVADATSLVLAYWMPDGAIDPKYVALMSLAGALWSVASKRRDADGNWRPLRTKPKPPAPVTGTGQAPAAPVNSLRV